MMAGSHSWKPVSIGRPSASRQTVGYMTIPSDSAVSVTNDNLFSSKMTPGTLETYNTLLADFALAGNPSDAVAVFLRMSSNEITADQNSYESIIQSWIRSDNTVVKRAREAEYVFNQLIKAGHIPSKEVTVSLIHLMGELNQPEKADRIFDRVSFAGAVCDVSVYNALIIAWGRSSLENAILKAEEVLERIEFAGLDPNSESFESLLTAWAQSNRKDSSSKCVKIIHKMEYLGLIPTLEAYERTFTALTECSLSDAPEMGMSILSSITGNSNVDSGSNILIEKKAGMNLDSVQGSGSEKKLLKDQIKKNENINEIEKIELQSIEIKTERLVSLNCYENLIAIWLKSGRDETSQAISGIIRNMEISTNFKSNDLTNIYSAIIISLCNSSNKRSKLINVAKADERLNYMESKGMKVYPGIYALLVESWCKLGNPQRAEIVLDKLSSVLLSQSSSKRINQESRNKKEKVNEKERGKGKVKEKEKEKGEEKEIDKKKEGQSKLPLLLLQNTKISAFPWNQVIAAYGVLKRSETRNEKIEVKEKEKGKDGDSGPNTESDSDSDLKEEIFLLYRAKNADRVYTKLLNLSGLIGKEKRERPIGELNAFNAIRPDRWTYSALVSVWSCCGRLDKAEEKLSLMVRDGIRPTPVTYASLLIGWLARYTAGTAAAILSASSRLLTLDPVSDVSGFYDENNDENNNDKNNEKGKNENKNENENKNKNDLNKNDRKVRNVVINNNIDIRKIDNDGNDYLDEINGSDLKILTDTALLKVKKIFNIMCRLTQNYNDESDHNDNEYGRGDDRSVGVMLGLEDGDGAYYCQVIHSPLLLHILLFFILVFISAIILLSLSFLYFLFSLLLLYYFLTSFLLFFLHFTS